MKQYRTELHGHLLEVRLGELGGEEVLLDGRPISRKPMAGLLRRSHRLELTDESGRLRAVEVRRHDISRLRLGRYRMVISVDGVERCRLAPLALNARVSACHNCGYSLTELPVVNDEVQCPECGRHTSAASMGRSGAGGLD